MRGARHRIQHTWRFANDLLHLIFRKSWFAAGRMRHRFEFSKVKLQVADTLAHKQSDTHKLKRGVQAHLGHQEKEVIQACASLRQPAWPSYSIRIDASSPGQTETAQQTECKLDFSTTHALSRAPLCRIQLYNLKRWSCDIYSLSLSL